MNKIKYHINKVNKHYDVRDELGRFKHIPLSQRDFSDIKLRFPYRDDKPNSKVRDVIEVIFDGERYRGII